MRIFLSTSLLLLLCLSAGFAEPLDQTAELKKYEGYGSRLAHARYRMLNRKNEVEQDSQWGSGRWHRWSGYGLLSEVYGGVYSPTDRAGGELDLYTGRKAVRQAIAIDSVRSNGMAGDQRSLSISNVEPVTVRSHPWREMLEEVSPGPELSSLFQMAPEDCFVVSFNQGSTIGDLERGLQSLVDGADVLFHFQSSLSATEMIAKRLGVENFRELEPLMGETLFVSEDLDFYPNTHYALIFEGGSLSKIGANLLLETEAQGRVGDAFVLATSKELFSRIEKAHNGDIPSLAQADDLKYCNAVLDHQRDGFCYLSEAFISKMVFPTYRINAARRKTTIDGLVERQYAVLAYRTIADRWPDSFAQMEEDNYLGSEVDSSEYLIDAQGRVEHKVWGSLWNLKALSEVPVERVSKYEKLRYDDFREDYDRLWTRFFDPVGVAFEVKEELRFHTIILPLVNSREYGMLELLSGGEPLTFKTLSASYLQSPASFHMKINLEDVVLSIMKGVPTDAGAEERLVARKEVNEELRGIQNLDESFDFFEILGEEFCLTFGPNLGFQDWDEPDLTVCLELKDKERFQAWLSAATPTYELKKKVSHGVEYVAVTKTHDWQSNLYALYEGDFVHLTTYQPAVERLCQQSSESRTDVAWFDSQWVGSTHNVMFRADLRHSPSFLSDVLDPSRTYQGRKQMRHAVGAAVDRMLARRSLSPEEVSAFFRFTPDSLYGIPITEKDGRIFLGEVPAEDIDLESYQVPPKDEAKGADVPQLWDLVEKYRDPQTVKKIQLFEQASVGMSFTPEGLSTRVSLNNPAYNPASLPVVADRARAVMWGIAGLTAVLASLLVFLRRKKQPPRQDVVS